MRKKDNKQDPEVDWLIYDLIHFMKSTSTSMPITIFVDGVFITGDLMADHVFLPLTRNEFQPEESIKGKFIDMMAFTSDYQLMMEHEKNSTPKFMNLANAKFYIAGSEPEERTEGVNIRIPLTKIAGFYPGYYKKV